MKATVRPRAASTPARMAAPLPRFSGNPMTWSAPPANAASAVPSVEPSSTTTISSPPSSATSPRAARIAAIVAPMPAASSRAGTITDARRTPGAGGRATRSWSERRTALSSTAR